VLICCRNQERNSGDLRKRRFGSTKKPGIAAGLLRF
jgi:hypothetical protein